jgi:hypothetical protein
LAAGLFCLGLFIVFGELYFAGACIFIFATSRGYMRRAKQIVRESS